MRESIEIVLSKMTPTDFWLSRMDELYHFQNEVVVQMYRTVLRVEVD